MNTAHIREAAKLWNALSDDAKKLAKDELGPRLRTTGLEATLRWLEQPKPGPQDLLRKFCVASGLESTRTARSARSNLEQLTDSRGALALAEALHVVARTANH